jgi:hypothetical protein
MAKLDDFYKNATDAEWEAMAQKRAKIKDITDKKEAEEAAVQFKKEYGFYPDSVRNFELMHFHDLKRIHAAEAENAELRATMEQLQKQIQTVPPEQGFPAWHRVKGESTKATLYTTKEAIDTLNAAVDYVEAEYGCKRCYAIAFVLEEGIKRLGIDAE